jgi:hypothetical protein
LSSFLGFVVDLIRGEVPAGFVWRNKLVSPQWIIYFHIFTLEQVQFCRFNLPPQSLETPDFELIVVCLKFVILVSTIHPPLVDILIL